MGKKSDAQLKSIGDKGEACASTANSLGNVLKAWPAINAEWDKWEDEMLKLPDWEQHPYAKKRIAVWQMGKDLAGKLKGEIHLLNVAVVEFKGYIAKKEKSKNPFKSKKSLPSSKDAIKMYEKALQSLNELYMKGTSAFH